MGWRIARREKTNGGVPFSDLAWGGRPLSLPPGLDGWERVSSASPVAIRATRTALAITSVGRFPRSVRSAYDFALEVQEHGNSDVEQDGDGNDGKDKSPAPGRTRPELGFVHLDRCSRMTRAPVNKAGGSNSFRLHSWRT